MLGPLRTRSGASLLLVPLLALVAAACGDLPTGPAVGDGAMAPVSITASSNHSLQATPPGHIRVGVVQSATEILLGAEGDFTVTNKATGATLFSGANGEVVAELLSAGTVDTRRWLQTSCTSEAGRDDWLARAEALGHETRTEYVPPPANCWRTQLGTLNQGWGDRVAFRNQAIADGLAGTDSYWPLVTIVHGETQLKVTHAGSGRIVDAPVVLSSADGLVRIAGRTYRGLAEVWTNSRGTLAGINELPLEQYVYGVVPRELPPGPYGLPEAQKAQAVAARTYAVANLGSRSPDGYDVVATTGHQVYGGYENEHPVSTAAVDATRGIVAVHEGKLITTLYHSTSGGWTANSEDVYSNPFDYLKGVPDAERGNALEHVPSLEVFKRHANPTNLRARAEGEFESDWSAYHRWIVDWTPAELATILAANLGEPITRVDAVRVTDRADQGRVRRIEFVTDAGTFHASKDAIRWTLQYYDLNKKIASLRSTLFFIEEVRDPRTKALTGWKAYGGGWGHGVGMSQTGAVGMAERGRTYEEILRHYYRGVELEER